MKLKLKKRLTKKIGTCSLLKTQGNSTLISLHKCLTNNMEIFMERLLIDKKKYTFNWKILSTNTMKLCKRLIGKFVNYNAMLEFMLPAMVCADLECHPNH